MKDAPATTRRPPRDHTAPAPLAATQSNAATSGKSIKAMHMRSVTEAFWAGVAAVYG